MAKDARRIKIMDRLPRPKGKTVKTAKQLMLGRSKRRR